MSGYEQKETPQERKLSEGSKQHTQDLDGSLFRSDLIIWA
jgi:hypothetical protein